MGYGLCSRIWTELKGNESSDLFYAGRREGFGRFLKSTASSSECIFHKITNERLVHGLNVSGEQVCVGTSGRTKNRVLVPALYKYDLTKGIAFTLTYITKLQEENRADTNSSWDDLALLTVPKPLTYPQPLPLKTSPHYQKIHGITCISR
jgi:hypothetical protein